MTTKFLSGLVLVLGFVLAPVAGSAQPGGAEGSAAPAADVPAADAPAADAPASVPPVSDLPTVVPGAAVRTPQEARQICAEAMNADPSFAEAIALTISEQTVEQHRGAAVAIAKNERHVILAYAAMWLLAAGFLLFLWRRQQGLKTEIAQLRRDLDVAVK